MREGPLQATLEQYLLGEAPALEDQSLDELERTRQIAAWLAGAIAGVPDLEQVDARADYLRLLRPFEVIAGDSVFRGREFEMDTLRRYIGVVKPRSKKLRDLFVWHVAKKQPAVTISGPGGVGKSAIVARFMLEHTRPREDERVPFGYLDFDRVDLDVGEPLNMCMELLRQLDLQFPGDDRFADIREQAVAD